MGKLQKRVLKPQRRATGAAPAHRIAVTLQREAIPRPVFFKTSTPCHQGRRGAAASSDDIIIAPPKGRPHWIAITLQRVGNGFKFRTAKSCIMVFYVFWCRCLEPICPRRMMLMLMRMMMIRMMMEHDNRKTFCNELDDAQKCRSILFAKPTNTPISTNPPLVSPG